MAGCSTPRTNSNPIFKSAVEGVIRDIGSGVAMRLVGTRWGMSYDDIENAIRADLREPRYGTPRCQRIRAWNVEKRLRELQVLGL